MNLFFVLYIIDILANLNKYKNLIIFSLKLSQLYLNKNLKIGIGALPSIFLYNDKLGARLGVSPRVDYKNIVLIAPFFHRDVTGEWIPSVGLGYKFHKK